MFLILILIVVVIGIISINRHAERKTLEQERAIMEAYLRVNYAVGRTLGRPWDLKHSGRYFTLEKKEFEINRFGIWTDIYLILKMYESETGLSLSYEIVVDFFSQEFEPDGSLRLYNSGKHPEIQAFVEWIWENHSERRLGYSLRRLGDDFIGSIRDKYLEYVRNNEVNGFESQPLRSLSPQMLDALVRAHNNPDYVLDLTSLQQQGY